MSDKVYSDPDVARDPTPEADHYVTAEAYQALLDVLRRCADFCHVAAAHGVPDGMAVQIMVNRAVETAQDALRPPRRLAVVRGRLHEQDAAGATLDRPAAAKGVCEVGGALLPLDLRLERKFALARAVVGGDVVARGRAHLSQVVGTFGGDPSWLAGRLKETVLVRCPDRGFEFDGVVNGPDEVVSSGAPRRADGTTLSADELAACFPTPP